MFCNKGRIVLASGSPRRREYLEELGLKFTVKKVSIDEIPKSGEDPGGFVVRMACEKAAAAGSEFDDCWIIAGDTVVCLGSKILGKPADTADAVDMLLSLSGREHTVRTGICLCNSSQDVLTYNFVETKVLFAAFDLKTAESYVATGECFDKAGAYGIQGKGACLVKSIEGSYSNVVGLPLYELLEMLKKYHVV